MNNVVKLLQRNKFYFRSEKLETVKHFNYLGFSITPNLSIKKLFKDLYRRGLKATFNWKAV